VCFEFLYNFCPKHSSFEEELSEIWSKMYIGLHAIYLLFMSKLNLSFMHRFSKKKNILKYQISLKSVQWEAWWSMRTLRRKDRQTGRPTDMKTVVTLSNFVNGPERGLIAGSQILTKHRNSLFVHNVESF